MCTSTSADRLRSQRGETLLETLIALAILAIIGGSLFAGFQVVIKGTAGQQRDGTAETLLRSYAERIQDPDTAYQARAGSACGLGRTYAAPTLPAGFTASVTDVQFWVRPTVDYGVGLPSTTLPTTFTPTCPASDSADAGLQQLQVTVTRPDGTSSSMHVLKRQR